MLQNFICKLINVQGSAQFLKFFNWIHKHRSRTTVQGQCLTDLGTYQYQLLVQGNHFTKAGSHKTVFILCFVPHPEFCYNTPSRMSKLICWLFWKSFHQSKKTSLISVPRVVFSSPSSCYSGANALYNWTICTTLPGLLANQSKGCIHKDPEFWHRSRLSSWCVQSESNCVWYKELGGTTLVASDSGWSSSNLSFPLTAYLSLVSLLSLWSYCQACKMGVI